LVAELFNRNLTLRYSLNRWMAFDPLNVLSTFPRLWAGGYDVIVSVLYVPERDLRGDFPLINALRLLRPGLWSKVFAPSPFAATLNIMNDMERAVAQSTKQAPMKLARSLSELDAILSQNKGARPIAVVHSVEGAHSLTGDDRSEVAVLRNLDVLFDRGVAYLTLAHFYPNQVVHPVFPFPEDLVKLSSRPTIWRDLTLGLTRTGQAIVERMIELGMLIDLSHSTPTARRQVYDIADASGKRPPLLLSHVGAYEINPSPYNAEDWEIKRIARDGGVFGVIFMPYWLMPKASGQGINFISRTIRHLVDVGGEDAVGIGSDFDGFTTPPEDLTDPSQLPRLTQRLLIDGHGEERIKKILGGNVLCALRAGWGRKGASGQPAATLSPATASPAASPVEGG
jgi:membrane dipeptidase